MPVAIAPRLDPIAARLHRAPSLRSAPRTIVEDELAVLRAAHLDPQQGAGGGRHHYIGEKTSKSTPDIFVARMQPRSAVAAEVDRQRSPAAQPACPAEIILVEGKALSGPKHGAETVAQ